MPRLTRAESQARTRDLLVATARELFLRDGYHATSLEKVADEAGFSKGAVYSNFRNKDELCLAVLDQIHHDEIARAVADVGASPSLEEGIAGFERWAERMIGDEGWTTLEVEFALQARRDPVLRQELADRDRAIREVIASVLAAHLDGDAATLDPRDMATALLSLGIGLGMQRVIDPSIPVDVLVKTLRALATGTRPL
ncbi:TetR/AcrR family transcriptional regulator [Kibdelosporangium persicum]|uniref:Toluene efflux pump ttgABC operon repressor n=1 Tax=Kibdelosporangium persicum TaxID=2698649 RepID=A0ABX2F4E7_9PSEU|nr:TetR/AcrR family transcriptional regulator [Kibdelosporangium persicum]NRN66044.1 Toluene efflux pump ttgABC operon repressor [Kibdelosporangium persicum]